MTGVLTEQRDIVFANQEASSSPMPTTFRLLAVLAAIAGTVYGALYFLANGLSPAPAEAVIIVPPEKFAR
ncbi:MAG: hypothetical protein ACRC7G_08835 [Beijerinckiaceae bacterium]